MEHHNHESKEKEDHDERRGVPQITLQSVLLTPNPAPLTEALSITLKFELLKSSVGQWRFQYLVDSIRKRHIIHLGQTDSREFKTGLNEVDFSVSKIDISGIKPSHLSNCGLLTATFFDSERDVVDVNMVVEVSKDPGVDGHFMRRIYNPLD